MQTNKRKLQLLAASSILLLIATAAGCHGFFVNPTLTSLTVQPQNVSMIVNGVQSLTATGNYDDNSTKDLTGTVAWTSSAPDVATVSASGKVTAAQTIANPPGTTTITATLGGLTATTTVTVNTGPLLSIAITASTTNPTAGSTVTFTAMGTYSGSSQQQNITNNVTWNSSNTAVIATIVSGSGAVSSTATTGSSTNVTASLNGITSNTLTITVQ